MAFFLRTVELAPRIQARVTRGAATTSFLGLHPGGAGGVIAALCGASAGLHRPLQRSPGNKQPGRTGRKLGQLRCARQGLVRDFESNTKSSGMREKSEMDQCLRPSAPRCSPGKCFIRSQGLNLGSSKTPDTAPDERRRVVSQVEIRAICPLGIRGKRWTIRRAFTG